MALRLREQVETTRRELREQMEQSREELKRDIKNIQEEFRSIQRSNMENREGGSHEQDKEFGRKVRGGREKQKAK